MSFDFEKKKTMKPIKSEHGRYIIYTFFFVFFLYLVASINELRFDNILNFGSCPSTISPNSSSSDDDVRIFIGILTLPEKYHRRHMLRMVYSTQSPERAKVDVRFVFCNLTTEEQQVLVALEIMQYDDIIILNCKENMDEGKTYTYFSSLPKMLKSSPGPSAPYHYVMKADDDTYLKLDKLVEFLRPLPRQDLYFGCVVPCQNRNPWVHIMSGMGYLISWDLVEWISVSEIPKRQINGPEDRMVAHWLREGKKAKNREIGRWMMYDFQDTTPTRCSHELWPNTIAVHLLKNDERWVKTLKYFNVTHNLKPSKLYHIP